MTLQLLPAQSNCRDLATARKAEEGQHRVTVGVQNKKGQETTTPFGVNFMRSRVLCQALLKKGCAHRAELGYAAAAVEEQQSCEQAELLATFTTANSFQ